MSRVAGSDFHDLNRKEGREEPAAVLLRQVADELRVHEAQLSERHVCLETMINHVPDYIYAKDREGRFLYANAAVVRNNGFERLDDMIGLTDADIHGQELARQIGDIERRVMETGAPDLGFEERAIRGDTDRWLMMSRVPLRSNSGEIIGVVGASRDISARKASERLMQAQARILEMIVEGVPTTEFLLEIAVAIEQVATEIRVLVCSTDDTAGTVVAACPSHPEIVGKAVASSSLAAEGAELLSYEIQSSNGKTLGCIKIAIIGWHPGPEYDAFFRSAARMAGIAIDRRRAEERICFLAEHDTLTGLPNRERFVRDLEQRIAEARTAGGSVGVAFLDLDSFKLVNDSLGHMAGDELIRQVSDRIRAAAGPKATVARIGGDEFVVAMAADEAFVSQMERVASLVSRPFTISGTDVETTCSVGIAHFPDHGRTCSELMANADAAMYRVKERGRDSVLVFDTEMAAAARDKLEKIRELKRAVERKEFVVHYQPQMDLRNRAWSGVEALVRWQHPTKGLVAPSQFIALAEETGLICAIGNFVLQEACDQARRWQDAGMPPLRIGVNMSARQFQEANVALKVAEVLRGTGLDPSWLEIEITESLIMHDLTDAIRKMKDLAAMGVRVALDDFGTGYSNLSSLKSFPLSRLKIDRSFVAAIPQDDEDAAIVAAVIALADRLGVETLAEGVETEEQLRHLEAAGCTSIQGYLIGKPASSQETIEMLGKLGAKAQLIHIESGDERSGGD